MKALFREPLVHFLILGAGMFVASVVLSDRDAPGEDDIRVGAGQVEHMVARFQRTWRRPPTIGELQGLIADHVREEAAYREGIALGLDRDDAVIRRRVRQKLDFIATDIAAMREPREEELLEYLAGHPDDFRIDPRFTFAHVYLDPGKRGQDLASDTRELLTRLNRNPRQDIGGLGDRLLLPRYVEDDSLGEIARVFGSAFAEGLLDLDGSADSNPPQWQGPVESGYGLHLVRVDSRTESRIPDLDEVRQAVRREWENDLRDRTKERFYEEIVGRYRVTVDWPKELLQSGVDPDAR
jgi:hypothetical protein